MAAPVRSRAARNMTAYTFRFRDAHFRIEAEFSLRFDSDAEARIVARELQGHTLSPVIEVKNGDVLVFHLDRRDRKEAGSCKKA